MQHHQYGTGSADVEGSDTVHDKVFDKGPIRDPLLSQLTIMKSRAFFASTFHGGAWRIFRAACAAVMIVPFCSRAAPDPIRLLVRGDDMGVAQSINEACIKAYREGLVRSVEVIVPGPWFLDAVRLLKENPELDVGVHLCLTSEWERCKWRPLTHSPSLVDENGYFFPMTSQRSDFPSNTGFLQANPSLEEVERELRAQIELARKHLPRVSHVSAHMGTATATPPLRALTQRLCAEYGLSMGPKIGEMRGLRGWQGRSAEEREASLAGLLENLKPGNWLLVEHPGLDTPEMRALGHKGYEDVAADRAGVLHAFVSPRIRNLVTQRGIELVDYTTTAPAP
jgi:predicted glycoside hydrolase/deacetylase ChbG (UPF0249 family)